MTIVYPPAPDAARTSSAPPRPARIVARAVTRSFGEREVLRDISLEVSAGEIHALLGPNGAGKTTLLRILAGLLARSGGELRVAGDDPSRAGREFRSRVGLIPPGERSFYLRISGLENLVFFGRLHGMTRRAARASALDLLARVGLGNAARLSVGAYSQGMQKRLAIARALLTDPAVMLVDEATHDLDPHGARTIRDLVADVARKGTSVLWATQRLDEITDFADRVTLLDGGTSRFTGFVHDFAAVAPSRRYVVRLRRSDGAPLDVRELAAAIGSTGAIEAIEGRTGDHYRLAVADGVELGRALAALAAVEAELLSCQREQSEIEEAFLLLTAQVGVA